MTCFCVCYDLSGFVVAVLGEERLVISLCVLAVDVPVHSLFLSISEVDYNVLLWHFLNIFIFTS